MIAFYFVYALYGAVQGWLVLRLMDGILEPKRTGRQCCLGQAAVILFTAAFYLGNLIWNQGAVSDTVSLSGSPAGSQGTLSNALLWTENMDWNQTAASLVLLLPKVLATTAGVLVLYRCDIWNTLCLNTLGWTGVTLADFFARSFLVLMQGEAGKQDVTLLMICPENIWYLALWSAAMLPMGIALNRVLSGKKQAFSESRQALPMLVLPAILILLCLWQMSEQLLVQWAVFLFCCLLLFAVLLAGIRKHDAGVENKVLQMKMSLLEDKYQALLENNGEHAILVHDIRNHLRTVSTMLEQKKTEEAARYLAQLNGEMETEASVTWSNHEMLDLILNMKFREARKAQIAIDCHCDDMSSLALKPAQVCALFSNLLDNAIEANAKCPAGVARKIVLQCARREKMLIVSLSNPVAGLTSDSAVENRIKSSRKPFETLVRKMEFPETPNQKDPFSEMSVQDKPAFETAKQAKSLHGFGMRSIQKVVDTYHGYMKTDVRDSTFYITVYLAAFEEPEQPAVSTPIISRP